MINTAAILNHLQASEIIEVREWASVLWVKAVVVGRVICRFVSKKIGASEMALKVIRKQWGINGDNYQLLDRDSIVESWSVNDFTLEGFIVFCCRKHGLDKKNIEIGDISDKRQVAHPAINENWIENRLLRYSNNTSLADTCCTCGVNPATHGDYCADCVD